MVIDRWQFSSNSNCKEFVKNTLNEIFRQLIFGVTICNIALINGIIDLAGQLLQFI